jgi:rhamnosyl/mannosyltransferase
MKSTSVLQIGKYYPPHMGGIETHLEALCLALHPSLDLRVVVCGDARKAISEVRDGICIDRAGRWGEVASTALCPGLASLIRRDTSDIVHLHLPNPMGCLAYLASGHAGKLVVTYHSDVVRQKALGRLFQPLLEMVLDRAAAILVTTREYLDTSATLASYRAKCHVVPYGINVHQVWNCQTATVENIRATYGEQIVLAVGRLVYYKGFEYLIEAMQSTPGRLLLIGDGPLRKPLEDLRDKLFLRDRVTFLGELQNEETLPYYRAAKVFALSSIARSEAFGIVQIEAMAAGTPVINTRLDSGVPAVSLDGITGLTVPARDPAALASAITEVLGDDSLRETFGARGKIRAVREFSVEAMKERVLRVYQVSLTEQTVTEERIEALAK